MPYFSNREEMCMSPLEILLASDEDRLGVNELDILVLSIE
jgi:hypothetical protein